MGRLVIWPVVLAELMIFAGKARKGKGERSTDKGDVLVKVDNGDGRKL